MPNNGFSQGRLNIYKSGPARFQKYIPEEDQETKDNKRSRRSVHTHNLKSKLTEIANTSIDRFVVMEGFTSSVSQKGFSVLLRLDSKKSLEFIRSAFHFEVLVEYADGTALVSSRDPSFQRFLSKVEGFGRRESGTNMVAAVHEIIAGQGDSAHLEKILSPFLFEHWPVIQDDAEYMVNLSIACDGLLKRPDKPKLADGEDESSNAYQVKVARWQAKCNEINRKWEDIRDEREDILDKFLNIYEAQKLSSRTSEILEGRTLPLGIEVTIAISGLGLRDLAINLPFLTEVSEPLEFDVPVSVGPGVHTTEKLAQILAPSGSSPVICVIDSGVQEHHPLLQASVVANLSKSYVEGGNGFSTSDDVPGGGHGTRVAGAIIYRNGVPERGQYKPDCRVVNVKVLNAHNRLPDDVSQHRYLNESVDRIRHAGFDCKVVNHSISTIGPCETGRMSSFAHHVDLVSHTKDIVFVQSSGNIPRETISDFYRDGVHYPDYLIDGSSRIANPGQSLTALTVGSIAQLPYQGVNKKSVASQTDEVSAFSRSGFGIWNTVKPEVVDYGGDYAMDTGTPPSFSIVPETAISLLRCVPGPMYSRDNVGTSFSTPRVSKLLAEIQNTLPNRTSLLYKAVLINGASWPIMNDTTLDIEQSYRYLQTYGFGIVNRERSLGNTESRVTEFTQDGGEIKANQTNVYKLDFPAELRRPGLDLNVRIDITLCFSAIPKRSKKKTRRYFSTWVDWRVSRLDEEENEFLARVIKGLEVNLEIELLDEEDNQWMLGNGDQGRMTGTRRSRGANQKDWAIFKSYDLPESLYVAVSGHQGWSNDPNDSARYALVMSYEVLR